METRVRYRAPTNSEKGLEQNQTYLVTGWGKGRDGEMIEVINHDGRRVLAHEYDFVGLTYQHESDVVNDPESMPAIWQLAESTDYNSTVFDAVLVEEWNRLAGVNQYTRVATVESRKATPTSGDDTMRQVLEEIRMIRKILENTK